MVKAIVTGSAGFLGSHMWKFLLKQNFEVFAIDRKTCDLSDCKETRDAIFNIEPDVIFHLAGTSNQKKWLDSWQSNITTTENVLGCAQSLGCRVVVVGSAAEYGYQQGFPVSEHDALNTISEYGYIMKTRTLLCQHFAEDVDVVMGRLFNPIGDGMGENLAIGSFMNQTVKVKHGMKDKIETGSLSIKRDFVDIDDVCRAFLLLSEKGRRGEVYNICSGQSHFLGDILGLIIKESNIEIPIAKDESRMRGTGLPDFYGSHEKITRDTGWKPEITIEESVRKAVQQSLQQDSQNCA